MSQLRCLFLRTRYSQKAKNIINPSHKGGSQAETKTHNSVNCRTQRAVIPSQLTTSRRRLAVPQARAQLIKYLADNTRTQTKKASHQRTQRVYFNGSIDLASTHLAPRWRRRKAAGSESTRRCWQPQKKRMFSASNRPRFGIVLVQRKLCHPCSSRQGFRERGDVSQQLTARSSGEPERQKTYCTCLRIGEGRGEGWAAKGQRVMVRGATSV